MLRRKQTDPLKTSYWETPALPWWMRAHKGGHIGLRCKHREEDFGELWEELESDPSGRHVELAPQRRDFRENLSLREWLKPSRTLTCRFRPKKGWQTRQWVHYKMAEPWFPRCGGSQAGFEVTSTPDWLRLAMSGSIHSLPPPHSTPSI